MQAAETHDEAHEPWRVTRAFSLELCMELVDWLARPTTGEKPRTLREPMNWLMKPFRAVVLADRDAYFWIKDRLKLGEYQMAALVWFSACIFGFLLGWWLT